MMIKSLTETLVPEDLSCIHDIYVHKMSHWGDQQVSVQHCKRK